jgi:hypothetical protein
MESYLTTKLSKGRKRVEGDDFQDKILRVWGQNRLWRDISKFIEEINLGPYLFIKLSRKKNLCKSKKF